MADEQQGPPSPANGATAPSDPMAMRGSATVASLARLVPVLALALLLAVTALCLVLTFAGLAARHSWIADLATNFRMQLGLALGLCGLLLGAVRWNGMAILALVAGAYNMVWVFPSYLPAADHSPPTARPFRVLVANVGVANTMHEAAVSVIRKEQPDIAMAIEVDDAWAAGLEAVRDQLPHGVLVAREDSFGMAVYSRIPISTTATQLLGPRQLPAVVVGLDMGAETLTLVAAHPAPPLTRDYARERDAYLTELTILTRNQPPPLALCGDLNTTQWSPVFADLVQGTGLRDASRGFGVQPTWNTFFPRLLHLPVDHCLVSGEIGVRGVRRGPAIGSDHLPFIVDLAISMR